MDEKNLFSVGPSGSQTLEVHYANWRNTIMIIDPSTQRIIYNLTGRGWRVPNEITNADKQHIGTTKTSSMGSKIIVESTGSRAEPVAFEIRNDKLMGMAGSPQYTSPAFDGQTMTWKNTAMSRRIIYTLIDRNGMALARFESNCRTMIGRLEIVDAGLDHTKMNEIVVVLLTLLKRKMKAIMASNSAAVSAAVAV